LDFCAVRRDPFFCFEFDSDGGTFLVLDLDEVDTRLDLDVA